MNKFLRRSEALGALLAKPFQSFAEIEAAGGFVMLAVTVLALLAANSGWEEWYEGFRHLKIALGIGGRSFGRSVHFWVNDGLMAVFFLVVGMEIKRELLVGELSSFRRAALPIAGALGGVLLPATIYYLFNMGEYAEKGWGIPMATDIAFVLTAATLLGARVPPAMVVFLMSLAIVDDLAARPGDRHFLYPADLLQFPYYCPWPCYGARHFEPSGLPQDFALSADRSRGLVFRV